MEDPDFNDGRKNGFDGRRIFVWAVPKCKLGRSGAAKREEERGPDRDQEESDPVWSGSGQGQCGRAWVGQWLWKALWIFGCFAAFWTPIPGFSSVALFCWLAPFF